MGINTIIISGNLTSTPELKNSNDVLFLHYNIAVNGYNSKAMEPTVDFIPCTAFGKTAEFICNNFTKGSPVIVEGSLKQNDFTDRNGVKHYSFQVITNRVHFAGRKETPPAQHPAMPAPTPKQSHLNPAPVSSLEQLYSNQDALEFIDDEGETL